jgi:hypothetical protein
MIREKESRSLVTFAARVIAVGIVALTTAFLSPVAQAKDKNKENPDDYTRVYPFTYDEVFQAAGKALLRLGWNVANSDKDKGIIQGTVIDEYLGGHGHQFEAHIETISSKPETRVTLGVKVHHEFMLNDAECRRYCARKFFPELQKVLATYQ